MYYYIRLTTFFQDNLGKPAPERQTILDFTAARYDGMAVALARPYANHLHLIVLFCSLAVLGPRVGHTMDFLHLSLSSVILTDSSTESCLRLDVVYPGRAWSSSPACTWHCSLHYFLLQAIPLFPRGVTIVC